MPTTTLSGEDALEVLATLPNAQVFLAHEDAEQGAIHGFVDHYNEEEGYVAIWRIGSRSSHAVRLRTGLVGEVVLIEP